MTDCKNCETEAICTDHGCFEKFRKGLQGVEGPERRLVGPAAQRPQPDDAEENREGSGVEPGAQRGKCPTCRGTGLQRTRIRRLLTEIQCPECRGTGERSGRLNDKVEARREVPPNPSDG